jgi:hypothetical protein
MIAVPPFAGVPQESVSWLTPAVAVGAEGVAGTVVIVIAEEAEDAVDVPAAFVAVTVNVTEVADGRPAILIGDTEPVAV